MSASAFSSSQARSLLILTALFLLSLPLVTTRIYASDEVQYFSYLRSLWFDRDVSFENEYQHFYESGVVRYPGFHETFLERQTATGRRETFATMGSALLWSPFYAVADVVVRVRRAMGDTSIEADGYSQPYVSAVAYGSAVYGWLSLVLSMVIARRLFGDRDRGVATGARGIPLALIAAIAVWIGTPLFFYMYIAPPMSHACSAFATALFVLVWLRVRERWSLGGLIALGALAALLAMVREQDVFVAIGPAIDWLVMFVRRMRAGNAGGARDTRDVVRLVVNAAAGVAAFGIAFAPQLMAYTAINGHPSPSRLVARKMSWMSPHGLQVLGSPQHGLLFWTPLILLSLAGLACLVFVCGDDRDDRPDRSDRSDRSEARDHSLIGICLMLMVATQVYVAGSVESWTVAGAFGQRRFVGLSAIFAIGLVAFLRALPAGARAPWPRRTAMAVVALAVWWNLGLMAQFGAGLMDRQRLEPSRNAYHTFVTIPRRLPDLAYRYVFERGSFFKKQGQG